MSTPSISLQKGKFSFLLRTSYIKTTHDLILVFLTPLLAFSVQSSAHSQRVFLIQLGHLILLFKLLPILITHRLSQCLEVTAQLQCLADGRLSWGYSSLKSWALVDSRLNSSYLIILNSGRNHSESPSGSPTPTLPQHHTPPSLLVLLLCFCSPFPASYWLPPHYPTDSKNRS